MPRPRFSGSLTDKSVFLTAAVVLLAGSIGGACRRADGPDPLFSESFDSSGTRLVTTLMAAWEDTVPLPASQPSVVIPAELPGTVIGSVAGAARLHSGELVVADGQGLQVLHFSRHGELLRVLGRTGDGPGEFRAIRTLSVLPGDTVAVYDPRLRRISLFPSDDAEPKYVTLGVGPPFEGTPIEVWALSGGILLVLDGGSLRDVMATGTSGPSLVGPPARLRLVALDSRTSVTLFEGGRASEAIQDGSTFRLPIFGRAVHVAAGRSGQVALTTSERHAVYRFDSPSRQLAVLSTFPSADRAFSLDELSSLQIEVASWEAANRAPNRTSPVLFRSELQPTTRPAFADLLMAPSGVILARAFEPLRRRSREWWLVDPDGSFRGRLTAPGRGDILEIGDDYVITLSHDEYDVPTVELRTVFWGRLARDARGGGWRQ